MYIFFKKQKKGHTSYLNTTFFFFLFDTGRFFVFLLYSSLINTNFEAQ